MISIGELERRTQERVVRLFHEALGYEYLGNWQDREEKNSNIETKVLEHWLKSQGYNQTLIKRALFQLEKAAALGEGKSLYDANREVYGLLRYGVKVKEEAGAPTQTVWLIDWEHPDNNRFAISEEVSIRGRNTKRPDIVLYINGIVIGVLELKRSTVAVSEGIRQNLDNQKKEFIRGFFTTIQIIMAGNDSEGLRYGTIETPEKYYLEWKEENPDFDPKNRKSKKHLPKNQCSGGNTALDCGLLRLVNKNRLLEIIHDFVVFDAGVKKLPRYNQYFAVKAAQKCIRKRDGGIIWHTQGSGKSLTMVWLARWIRENVKNSRVLVITDRTELDEQIEKVFKGVGEDLYRTKSGADLISQLGKADYWLIGSLVHKFGRSDAEAMEEFLKEVEKSLPGDFEAKGNFFVFVDEAHRTQSGKLHGAMRTILPDAIFIGFTGTPLLKRDKKKSVEVFGPYIHTYKFDEGVQDGVILDLRYEARDIDQALSSPEKVDRWFEAKTRGLSDMAKMELKKKWGTMKKVLSSRSRLEKIVTDILMDMDERPRLMDGMGNAMLVSDSVYNACRVYEMFSNSELSGKCAIVTSYRPHIAKTKGETTGAGETEELKKYEVYKNMLANWFDEPEEKAINRIDEFEQQVKEKFVNEPGQMRLIIVVDKLLTGFDAPPATYLYIDKKMRDHGLFQAVARVNRIHTEDKEYGFIIDYKDLFHSLERAVKDYTGGAFEDFDSEDVAGLLKDRLQEGRQRLEETREAVKALCEKVEPPFGIEQYLSFFCAEDTGDKEALANNEPKRIALYKAAGAFLQAFANLANEMPEAGYSQEETREIRREAHHYEQVVEAVKLASGDYLDLKMYEPAMRRLLDTYIDAKDSKVLARFDERGIVDLLVDKGLDALDELPEAIKESEEAVAETIENNIRKVIIDEQPVNPKYYEKMSELLDELIRQRRQQAIDYQKYLNEFLELAKKVKDPREGEEYPEGLDTSAKRALFDNLGKDEALAIRMHDAVLSVKKADWRGNEIKEREIKRAIYQALEPEADTQEVKKEVDRIFELVKSQEEY